MNTFSTKAALPVSMASPAKAGGRAQARSLRPFFRFRHIKHAVFALREIGLSAFLLVGVGAANAQDMTPPPLVVDVAMVPDIVHVSHMPTPVGGADFVITGEFPQSVAASGAVSTGAVDATKADFGANVGDLLMYARQNNPSFAQVNFEAQVAQERIASSGAFPEPTLKLELMDFTNTMNGRSASVFPGQVGETRYGIMQTIPAWGKRDLEVQAAQARADQALSSRDVTWVTLEADIKAAWLRYYAADRELVLAKRSLVLLQGLEDATLAGYKNNEQPQQAVLRVQGEVTRQRVVRVELEQQRKGLAAALNALLNRPAHSALAAPGELSALPEALQFENLLTRMRAIHPALQEGRFAVNVTQVERDQVYRDRIPDLDVSLTHNRPRDGGSSWDVMFEVKIPLQQSVRRSRESEARLLVDAAQAKLDATESGLMGELGLAFSTYNTGKEALTLLRGTLVPQVQAARDSTRAAFAAGQVDFDTILEAERQVVETQIVILQNEVATRLALVEIEKLSGEWK